jgi:hypothetical protein
VDAGDLAPQLPGLSLWPDRRIACPDSGRSLRLHEADD